MEQKQRHLYFYDEPNTGKTTFWKTQLKSYNLAPPNNDWVGFNDSIPWVIFDEFSSDSFSQIGI